MSVGKTRGAIRDFVVGRGRVRAMAVAADGSGPVDFPEVFVDLVDDVMTLGSGLDVIHPDDHGPAIAAFQTVAGVGSALVRVHDDSNVEVDLCLLDAAAEFGCYLALLVPAAGDSPDAEGILSLPPRRFGWTAAANGHVESVDDNVTRRLGWTADDLIGDSVRWLIHPDEQDRGVQDWMEMLASPSSVIRNRRRFVTITGEWVWCEVSYENRLRDPDHGDVVVEVLDITDEMAAQEALREREELLAKLTEALPSGVMHLDGVGSVEFVNSRWGEITGSPRSSFDDLCDSVIEPADLHSIVDESMRSDVDCDIELRLATQSGHPVEFVSLRVRPLEIRARGDRGLLLVLDDVTAQRRRRDNLTRAALRDPLTGVLNRAGLETELAELLAQNADVAVLFCDLDQLKTVNDLFGHASGDEAIRRLANALAHVVRSDDIVGRMGGDEFVVALPGADDAAVARIVRDVTARLGGPPNAVDGDTALTCSIGVARRQPGETLASLLMRADTEMYRTKKLRRRELV